MEGIRLSGFYFASSSAIYYSKWMHNSAIFFYLSIIIFYILEARNYPCSPS